MAGVYMDFAIARAEDAVLALQLQPPTAIGGRNIQFQVQKRFGGVSGLIVRSVDSGFNGASGITITNSGQGQLNVAINAQDTSGLDYGAFAYGVTILSSGIRSVLVEGFMLILPTV